MIILLIFRDCDSFWKGVLVFNFSKVSCLKTISQILHFGKKNPQVHLIIIREWPNPPPTHTHTHTHTHTYNFKKSW